MNKPVTRREQPDIGAIIASAKGVSAGLPKQRALRWSLAAVAILAVAVTFWTLRGRTPAVRYITEPVTRAGLVVTVTATGSVQPTNKVDVSSELSGTVRRVLVDYNSPVKAGQQLAVLDTDKLVAALDSSRAKVVAARARVADAEAAVVQTEKELARKRALAVANLVRSQS